MALISFTVTAKLICTFVFVHAKHWFSHDRAHLLETPQKFFLMTQLKYMYLLCAITALNEDFSHNLKITIYRVSDVMVPLLHRLNWCTVSSFPVIWFPPPDSHRFLTDSAAGASTYCSRETPSVPGASL